MPVTARRLLDRPIIRPHMDARMGANINGPSLIRVPPWATDPPGRYALYFADHRGAYIRLAFADALEGPWRLHEVGCLPVTASLFCTSQPSPDGPRPDWAETDEDWLYPHVASPDVHVDPAERRIRMYFHGLLPDGSQETRVALSSDGLRFEVRPELLGPSYFRCFQDEGWHYALAMPDRLLRSRDGLGGFEAGPRLGLPGARHSALLVRGRTLQLCWSIVGEAPERLYFGRVDLTGDWRDWRIKDAAELLRPERSWEGADQPLRASKVGAADEAVNQLRDPCLFEEAGPVYLLYSCAGESGIGLAELEGL